MTLPPSRLLATVLSGLLTLSRIGTGGLSENDARRVMMSNAIAMTVIASHLQFSTMMLVEDARMLWPAVLAHSNYILHAAGWIEGGLTHSYEKFILDIETLAMLEALLNGFEVNDDTLALAYIEQVGPGGHHFDRNAALLANIVLNPASRQRV